MEQLGLSAHALFALGITEHSDSTDDLNAELNQNELLLRRPDELKIERMFVKEEAIIQAFAKMIEVNNAEILKQLKSAGVL